MSDTAQQPSAAVQKLIDKFTATMDSDETAASRFAKLDTLIRLALDPQKHTVANTPQSVLAHLKGCLVASPMFGIHKIVAAFSLLFSSEGKKVLLKTKCGDVFRLKEDEANSSRHLIETACVKLLQEYEQQILPTYTLHSRSAHISALAPYGKEQNQYIEYLVRLDVPQTGVTYVKLDEGQVIDADTGAVILTALVPGKGYVLQDPDRSRMQEILQHCQKNGVSLKLELTKEWQVSEFLGKFSALTKISSGSGPSVLAYEAGTMCPTYPLVPGPESESALTAVVVKLREWLSTGKAVYNPSVFCENDPEVRRKQVNPVYEAIMSKDKPQEKAFPAIPGDVKNIYHEAIAAGTDGVRQVLEKHGITNQSSKIYHLTTESTRNLPKSFGTMVNRLTFDMPTPGARILLKYVHFALSEEGIYEKSQVKNKMPLQPWLAAVNLICRQLKRFNLDDAIKVKGDYFPAQYAIAKGMVTAQAASTGKNPKKTKEQKPKPVKVPGVMDHKPNKSKNPYTPRQNGRNYLTDQQLAQFAQASVSAMLGAQRITPMHMPLMQQQQQQSAAGAYGLYSGPSSSTEGEWAQRSEHC